MQGSRVLKLHAPFTALLFSAIFSSIACGGSDEGSGGDPECTGTVSDTVTGPFTCLFQASYVTGSVLTLTSSDGPQGTTNITMAVRLRDTVTPRAYEFADFQSVTGQLTNDNEGIFLVNNQPPRGTTRMVITKVDADLSTSEEKHYGLAGSLDATLFDGTGTTTRSVGLHFDF